MGVTFKAHDPTINQESQQRFNHMMCIRVYRPNDNYLRKIVSERFKRVKDLNQLSDLQVSELRQAIYTFNRTRHFLRNEAKDTIHQMNQKAKVPCSASCRQCQPLKIFITRPAVDQEADNNVPEDAVVPTGTEENPW